MRLALHDWVVAWDRRAGVAWLAGRAVDGDARGLARRLDEVHARLDAAQALERPARTTTMAPFAFRSGLSQPDYEAGVETVRRSSPTGDIYQANLTRRLETPFGGDPWTRYRRLRTGDPSLFSAYLDLGHRPRPDGRVQCCPRRPSRSCRSIRRGRRHGSDQGHPSTWPRPRPRIARSPASCWRAPRTAPRT